MSARALRHTPWSDVCDLVAIEDEQDAEGYGVKTPTNRTVFCDWQDGVSQKEFYYSHKAGLIASASVEIQAADYAGEKFVEFGGKRYRVLRSFMSSFDCLTLILSEVV